MNSMNEKVAIVTGGSGGIGSAICKAFVNSGSSVSVADLDMSAAKTTAKKISEGTTNTIATHVDVTNEFSVESAVNQVIKHFGRVDYLVHSAGNNIKAPILNMSLSQWKSSLDINLTGAFLLSKAVATQMVKQGEGGRIVFISSVAGITPVPERGSYGPAKAGMINLAGMLSLEWAKYNITVNAVCPGVTLTPMTEMVYKREPELRAERLKRMPLNREVMPEEIADLVLFLCSEKSAYITGTAVPIDGGFLNSGFFQTSDE